MRQDSRRAFTLVELLVVVAIVALLIAVLIPVVTSARRAALTANCLSNLRNLEMAHWLYMEEHDGRMIDVGLGHGGEHQEEEIAWINTLEEYYEHALLVRSPADDSPHWPLDQGGEGIPIPGTTEVFRRTSYGVNNFLSTEGAPDPANPYNTLSRVPSHSHVVHFVIMAEEGEFAGADHVEVQDWYDAGDPDGTPTRAAEQMATNLHGGKAGEWDARSNYGFLDGHVETLLFSDVYLNPAMNRFDPAEASKFALRKALRE